MALPSNASWDVGVNPTAAHMNARIRDTIQWLRNRPRAILTISSGISISNNTVTAVSFNNELVDTDGGHSNSVVPTRYQVQTPGIFHLNANIEWANLSGATVRDAWFQHNIDATHRYGWQTVVPKDAGLYIQTHMLISTHIRLELNDEVYLMVYQNSGGAVTLNNARCELLWVSK